MTDYTILKGMADWTAKYNQFVGDNVITDTGWITEGITFLNGAVVANSGLSSKPKYRTLTFAGSKLTVVQASVTTTKDGQGLSFPTGVSPENGGVFTITRASNFTSWSWSGDNLICHYEKGAPTTGIFNGIYFVFLNK